MISPIRKSSASFKEEEEEASKPKEKVGEKVAEPLPSQSVPLKETTSNGDAAFTEGYATSPEGVEASALELLQQEVCAANFKAIQQEPVAVLESGMSTDHSCIWITIDIHTYSPDASLFDSTSPQRSASF
jgi:hypothetical protein